MFICGVVLRDVFVFKRNFWKANNPNWVCLLTDSVPDWSVYFYTRVRPSIFSRLYWICLELREKSWCRDGYSRYLLLYYFRCVCCINQHCTSWFDCVLWCCVSMYIYWYFPFCKGCCYIIFYSFRCEIRKYSDSVVLCSSCSSILIFSFFLFFSPSNFFLLTIYFFCAFWIDGSG